MFRFLFHTEEGVPSEAFQSNLFERFADEIRVSLIPEIASAIDDAVSERHADRTIHGLTTILAKLCSADDDEFLDGIKSWRDFILATGLQYSWIEVLK